MAVRKIVKEGEEVLRKKSEEVTEFGGKTDILLDDMKETLIAANGAGLAAVQVGVLKRIFVVGVDEGYFEFINPVIVKQKGKQVGEEGCLSVENKYGTVARPRIVEIEAFNRKGEKFKIRAEGFFARAICHEYDHLEGILYTDKAVNIETVKRK